MRRLIPVLLLLLLAGCASTPPAPHIAVTIEAVAGPSALTKNTYLLVPGNAGVSWSDPQYQEYATYLARALADKGFMPARSATQASVAILVYYGSGAPASHLKTYNIPLPGRNGVTGAGTSTSPHSGGHSRPATDHASDARYLIIEAYDYPTFVHTRKLVPEWTLTAATAGYQGPLGKVFPVLVAAAAPYIAADPGQKIAVSLTASDEAVQRIMKRNR